MLRRAFGADPVTAPSIEVVNLSRKCTKTGCRGTAVATLTYVYSDQSAVLGPLATYAEPHTYDLCADHATRLTAPRGWEVVRLATEYPEPEPTPDDLLALADAVREAGRPRTTPPPPAEVGPVAGEVARRGHLRMLRGSAEA